MENEQENEAVIAAARAANEAMKEATVAWRVANVEEKASVAAAVAAARKASAKIEAYGEAASGYRAEKEGPKVEEDGTVDVRDFGAVGDGVHDDTAAIQAAIDSVRNDPSEKGSVGNESP